MRHMNVFLLFCVPPGLLKNVRRPARIGEGGFDPVAAAKLPSHNAAAITISAKMLLNMLLMLVNNMLFDHVPGSTAFSS